MSRSDRTSLVSRSLGQDPGSTHDAVLLHLKRQGEMTVADLCLALGITAMAVRRHLISLKREELVTSRMVRQVRGRPAYRFRLTDKAESLFPSGFQSLALDLLDTVFEQSGHKGVMSLLRARNQRMAERFEKRTAQKSLPQRVEEVARIYLENGYMTEWEALPDGNYLIFQRHCAVHDLANQYRQLCVLEPRLIQDLLGVKVSRQQYMLNHDPVCGYLVHADSPISKAAP